MSTPQPKPNLKPNLPVTLSFDEVDDLIYTARSNDLDALKTDIERLSKTYDCSPSSIIRSAIDAEEESEGGTGGCLLHWPAANGYLELLTYLLQTVINASETSFINHRNYSGNTALHWAALNTQLDCVKALTEAGADISAKNDSGHDAIFLAEQADWSPVQVGDEGESTSASASASVSASTSTSTSMSRYEVYGVKVESRARQVVEWLLGCEKAAGLERSSTTGSAAVEHEEEEGEGEEAGTEEMEGVEAANGIKIK
ncbi:Ankyrin repeat-containing domain protein [Elaphomyces granulatus]|jgi:hypothetical protein